MSTATNTNQTSANVIFVVSATDSKAKGLTVNQKEEETKKTQPVSGFAKNTRYSIYNNGGGYTGL
ncbi:hypothetical protein HRG84_08415 [Flavisolibacter sp. BT320]|nr:hypothetical protein [Flavisolibacter longurius]